MAARCCRGESEWVSGYQSPRSLDEASQSWLGLTETEQLETWTHDQKEPDHSEQDRWERSLKDLRTSHPGAAWRWQWYRAAVEEERLK
jgi:hypothetical protein